MDHGSPLVDHHQTLQHGGGGENQQYLQDEDEEDNQHWLEGAGKNLLVAAAAEVAAFSCIEAVGRMVST